MDATVILTSPDGKYWKEFKYIFKPGQGNQGGWGQYQARINSIIWLPPVYVGFFDGGEINYDNYEEKCGIVVSHDLENLKK